MACRWLKRGIKCEPKMVGSAVQAIDVRGAAALDVAERMGVLAAIRERSTKLTGVSIVDAAGKETFRSTDRHRLLRTGACAGSGPDGCRRLHAATLSAISG
jgi:hypothetical protein